MGKERRRAAEASQQRAEEEKLRAEIGEDAFSGLVALMLLSGCTDGRWVVHDLSNVSFEFTGPSPSGPFTPTSSPAVPR